MEVAVFMGGAIGFGVWMGLRKKMGPLAPVTGATVGFLVFLIALARS